MKMHKNHLRLLILLLLVLLACVGYMTVGVRFESQKLFAYAMRIRTPKLIAMLITAFAIGSASIVFQSIINNTIVTPCLLGMDQLYSLIHTAVFFVAGSGSFLAVNANAAFAVDLTIMGAVATVIYSELFRKTNHNVLYVLLIGTVLTSFFSSIQTTLTRVMDPNEYDTLLTDLVASLQAVGDTVLSMVSLIIGAVVNIILDPIMIFGLLGCPAMGIRGAAIATVIGQLIGAVAALWFNRVKNPVIHVRLKGYRFLWQDVADIYRVGLPTIVMQAIGSVMTFAVNGILLGVSSTAVAFFGIYYKLKNFLIMPVNGLGQAAIPVVGFNYGSGQSHRVKQAWKVLLPTGVVFALCGTAVFLLFPAQLLGLFSASDEMLAFGVPALRIISVTFLFAVITILCGYFASGLGNGVINMIGSALRQMVVLVPCLWLLIRTMGIEKAWFAFWVSEVVACAYSLWATKKELRNKVK